MFAGNPAESSVLEARSSATVPRVILAAGGGDAGSGTISSAAAAPGTGLSE